MATRYAVKVEERERLYRVVGYELMFLRRELTRAKAAVAALERADEKLNILSETLERCLGKSTIEPIEDSET